MTVAYIPVRGGSKSIPLKNIKEMVGKPLVYWTVKAANDAKCIDKVFVATDSDEIKKVVDDFNLPKVSVVDRSEESASDTASTEYAMLEFAQNYDFDNIVLIQATSPLLEAKDIEAGYELFLEPTTDSVLSVVSQKRFNWEIDVNGFANATNYDVYQRPRRQEFEGYYVENGAFYITSKRSLITSKNRISGRIKAYVMDEDTYFEIDEPSDWVIVEGLLKARNFNIQKIDWSKVKMFLTDCDGVLTDGGMYYSENGDELKKFNTRDGMGFKLLRERGIVTGIITGENKALNRRRFEKMSVDEIHQGATNKLDIIKLLCEKYHISMENVVFVGDDINDLESIKNVGIGCAVANAEDIVKACAKYISSKNGGCGAVREIVNKICNY